MNTKENLLYLLNRAMPNIKTNIPNDIIVKEWGLFVKSLRKLCNGKTPNSIFSEENIISVFIDVVNAGLSFSESLKHIYLSFYADKISARFKLKYIISYFAYIYISKKFGYNVKTIVVYDGDNFSLSDDSGKVKYKFEKINFVQKKEDLKLVFCVAQNTKEDVLVYEIMSREQINVVKEMSIKYNPESLDIWDKFYEEMAKKTVIKRLLKTIITEQDVLDIMYKDNVNDFIDFSENFTNNLEEKEEKIKKQIEETKNKLTNLEIKLKK
jgi:recombinational DNA repair protein RecT